jgi:hypothetical protein
MKCCRISGATRTAEKPFGPVAAGELQRLAAARSLEPTDLVWKEGMAQWVPASTIKGLFPSQPVVAPLPVVMAKEQDQPRRRRRRAADDEDALKKPAGGMSMGLKIGLTLGGIAVGLAAFLVLMVVTGVGGPVDYTVDLPPQTKDVRYFDFNGGVHYRIALTSEANSDVDIYMLDPRTNGRGAGDDSMGPNSLVNLRPAVDSRFKVEIVNLGPGANRSHVDFEEVGASPR